MSEHLAGLKSSTGQDRGKPVLAVTAGASAEGEMLLTGAVDCRGYIEAGVALVEAHRLEQEANLLNRHNLHRPGASSKG